MDILVIENEKPAADKLIRLLDRLDSTIRVLKVVETVEDTVNWLRINKSPDLMLMDIQLDDGLCFEIFETVNVETPVIFITAYDEYTLRAFKVNSVDYLLKPVDEGQLASAISKFRKIHQEKATVRPDFNAIVQAFANHYKSRFLVKTGNKYRSVPVIEISHFHICERSVFIRDFQGREHGIDNSLDQLQNFLDPDIFFRINRDCIVNISSILLMHSYSSSRLHLTLKAGRENEEFVVSRERVPDFKKWIDK